MDMASQSAGSMMRPQDEIPDVPPKSLQDQYLRLSKAYVRWCLAMIVFPAALFGGETWYKRLGWVTVLTGLFSVMSIYPLAAVGWGIYKRVQEGRYCGVPMFTDVWHGVLSVMTVGVAVWTAKLAMRAWGLVKKLKRGEFEE